MMSALTQEELETLKSILFKMWKHFSSELHKYVTAMETLVLNSYFQDVLS